MTPADESVLAEFCQRFGQVAPPRQFGDPNHCSECEDANKRLLALSPDDLDAEFLREPSRSWFLAWMGFEGFCFFLPGFCRGLSKSPAVAFPLCSITSVRIGSRDSPPARRRRCMTSSPTAGIVATLPQTMSARSYASHSLEPKRPNHALQRTRLRVTAPAFMPAHRLRPPRQQALRRSGASLSLGSFGD
jgi:hypothetical protein